MSDAFPESSRIPIVECKGWAGSEAVYVAVYRDLLRVAFLLTGSGPAAEDVVHDVFAKVGPHVDTLAEPAAYLRVAVVNRCRSLHRRNLAAPQPDRAMSSLMDVGLVELRDALIALPIRQRSAIVLRYLCDLPEEEIAANLKCRRSTVRTLVRRGLAELREVIR
ncbi:MAG: sigma-70 family RNA polymerase sigma factor [Ilumatobacteraceae bacterium]